MVKAFNRILHSTHQLQLSDQTINFLSCCLLLQVESTNKNLYNHLFFLNDQILLAKYYLMLSPNCSNVLVIEVW